MVGIFDTSLAELASHMSYRTFRQEIISSNLANVDTPGYVAKDVRFEKELQGRLTMVSSDPRHLTPSQRENSHPVQEDPFSRIGNDTNTVDIDREMMKLSQNHILFNASAQIISNKLEALREVIRSIR
ncbi:MAG TPA: flagellar basal body rod protein FlgB [Deltaproteobacteria bacterium]|nr:flagellar basal body rod protein FlgB [Deltaproteobacteria bacterium]